MRADRRAAQAASQVERDFGSLEDWAERQTDQQVSKYTDDDGVQATWISSVEGLPPPDLGQ